MVTYSAKKSIEIKFAFKGFKIEVFTSSEMMVFTNIHAIIRVLEWSIRVFIPGGEIRHCSNTRIYFKIIFIRTRGII